MQFSTRTATATTNEAKEKKFGDQSANTRQKMVYCFADMYNDNRRKKIDDYYSSWANSWFIDKPSHTEHISKGQ